MKIRRIHVENFGVLNNVDQNLSDGCNSILKDNGWGKSTLAAFVRTMFYGMEGDTKKKNLSERDRANFKPWGNGTFGGEIEFEANGKRYVLNRTFGKKKDEDTFSLTDAVTHLPSDDFIAEDIGIRLFGVDNETFRRTSFIDHFGLKYAGANSAISSKVTPQTQVQDLNNFDSATDKMKKYLNSNSPTKGSGTLKTKKTNIETLNRELAKVPGLTSTLEEKRSARDSISGEKEALNKEIIALTEEQKKCSEVMTKTVNFENYLELKKEAESRKNIREEKLKYFGGGEPCPMKVDRFFEQSKSIESKALELNRMKEEDSVENRLSKLKRYFKDNPPTEDVISEKVDLANRIQELVRENGSLEENISKDRVGIYPLEEDLRKKEASRNEKINNLNRLREEKAEISKNSEDTEETVNLPEEKNTWSFFLIAATVFVVLGILFVILAFVLNSRLLFLGLGGISFLAGLVLILLGSMRRKKERAERAERIRNLKKIADEKAKIKEDDNMRRQEGILRAESDVQGCEKDIAYLKESIEKLNTNIRANTEKTEENIRKTEEAEKAVKGFLEEYDLAYSRATAEDTLYEMRGNLREYVSMQKESEERTLDIRKREKELAASKAALKALYDEIYVSGDRNLFEDGTEPDYGKISNFVSEYHVACSNLETAKREEEDAELKFRQFASEHPETEEIYAAVTAGIPLMTREEADKKSREISESIEKKNMLKDEKADLLSRYDRTIDDDVTELDRLRGVQAERDALEEELEEGQKKYDVVEKTNRYLSQAKEQFIARYTGPIKTAFDRYIGMFLNGGKDSTDPDYVAVDTGEFSLDANLGLMRKEQGVYRNLESQSDGYGDMIGLCMRLALLDAMYTREKPIIIMDDPFVNLDKKNLAGAGEFLKKVSKEYQIMYFTCHEDRM